MSCVPFQDYLYTVFFFILQSIIQSLCDVEVSMLTGDSSNEQVCTLKPV